MSEQEAWVLVVLIITTGAVAIALIVANVAKTPYRCRDCEEESEGWE